MFHTMNKSLVDSRSKKGTTCPIPIYSWLDPALLKHLDAFDGFKLYCSNGVYRYRQLLCKEMKNLSWVFFWIDECTENMGYVFLKNNTECFHGDYVELICDVVAENIPVFILGFDFLFFSFQCGLTSFVVCAISTSGWFNKSIFLTRVKHFFLKGVN